MDLDKVKLDKVKLKITHQSVWSVRRIQFPLVECEALTIHKSQGQTYQCIAVDITQPALTRALRYVALSCVTKLNSLYIIG